MEQLREGTLNGKQLNMLLSINDREYGRVMATAPTQGIRQLTNDIIEVHVSFSKGHVPFYRQAVVWFNSKGQIVATAILLKGETQAAESHWRTQDILDKFGTKAITTRYPDGLWGISGSGAVPKTRAWIRKQYA